MKPSRTALGVLVLAVIAAALYLRNDLIGLVGLGAPRPAGGIAAADAATASEAPPATPIETAAVYVGAIENQVNAVGTLIANESVVLRPETAGRIVRIGFTEGQKVASGTVLVELDGSTWRAEFAQAEADLGLSRANATRAQELYRRQIGTGRSRDEATAQLKADEARAALAQARLDKMLIRAPFAGYIGLRQVSLGDYVAAGQDMVSLQDVDPLKVDFRIPELFLSQVKVGQPLQVIVDAMPGQTFPGQVYAIDPLVDPNGRSILLRATLPNPQEVLRPGLFARVSLSLGRRDDATLVPEAAIVPREGRQHVYRVVENKAQWTEVELGLRRTGVVEVLSGVAPGEVVVTAGQQKLHDGAAVTTLPPPAGT